MDILYLIFSFAIIGIVTALFVKFILYDAVVERNLDKIIAFFNRGEEKWKMMN